MNNFLNFLGKGAMELIILVCIVVLCVLNLRRESLPERAERTYERMPIIFYTGIRSGTDFIALGNGKYVSVEQYAPMDTLWVIGIDGDTLEVSDTVVVK